MAGIIPGIGRGVTGWGSTGSGLIVGVKNFLFGTSRNAVGRADDGLLQGAGKVLFGIRTDDGQLAPEWFKAKAVRNAESTLNPTKYLAENRRAVNSADIGIMQWNDWRDAQVELHQGVIKPLTDEELVARYKPAIVSMAQQGGLDTTKMTDQYFLTKARSLHTQAVESADAALQEAHTLHGHATGLLNEVQREEKSAAAKLKIVKEDLVGLKSAREPITSTLGGLQKGNVIGLLEEGGQILSRRNILIGGGVAAAAAITTGVVVHHNHVKQLEAERAAALAQAQMGGRQA